MTQELKTRTAPVQSPPVEPTPVHAGAVIEDGVEPKRTVSTAVRRGERGMVSAEWAVGIIAAIAIAGVLLTVVTSGPVEKMLLSVILKIIATFTVGLG